MNLYATMRPIVMLIALLTTLAACSGDTGYTNVDNDELQNLLAQGIPLYDIRRPEEWRETGVISGSRRMTFFEANGQVNPEFLPKFTQRIGKDEAVILICRTGNRTSALAKHLVEKMGYTKVYNVTRGITGWLKEKREVSRH